MQFRTYNKYKDKAVMFYSAASPKDAQQVLDAGASEILVSYHYLRKRKKVFTESIMQQIKDRDGLFMTDSGGFSFIHSLTEDEGQEKEEFWLDYLHEYVEFLKEYKDYIFVAANLDLDNIVGRAVVDKWNAKYFKPLEKIMNIVYVVQRDFNNVYADGDGMKRFKEYCGLHKYVGVNQAMKKSQIKINTYAKTKGVRIHGFAWTGKEILDKPVFSVDSSTWLSGQRFGSTYRYDGKNFNVLDGKKKFRRKGYKKFIKEQGLNYENILADKTADVTLFNAINWKGFRDEFIKRANVKLINKPIAFYEKSTTSKKSATKAR